LISIVVEPIAARVPSAVEGEAPASRHGERRDPGSGGRGLGGRVRTSCTAVVAIASTARTRS